MLDDRRAIGFAERPPDAGLVPVSRDLGIRRFGADLREVPGGPGAVAAIERRGGSEQVGEGPGFGRARPRERGGRPVGRGIRFSAERQDAQRHVAGGDPLGGSERSRGERMDSLPRRGKLSEQQAAGAAYRERGGVLPAGEQALRVLETSAGEKRLGLPQRIQVGARRPGARNRFEETLTHRGRTGGTQCRTPSRTTTPQSASRANPNSGSQRYSAAAKMRPIASSADIGESAPSQAVRSSRAALRPSPRPATRALARKSRRSSSRSCSCAGLESRPGCATSPESLPPPSTAAPSQPPASDQPAASQTESAAAACSRTASLARSVQAASSTDRPATGAKAGCSRRSATLLKPSPPAAARDRARTQGYDLPTHVGSAMRRFGRRRPTSAMAIAMRWSP